jgi:hypothetical protein
MIGKLLNLGIFFLIFLFFIFNLREFLFYSIPITFSNIMNTTYYNHTMLLVRSIFSLNFSFNESEKQLAEIEVIFLFIYFLFLVAFLV